jgi:MFS family permease
MTDQALPRPRRGLLPPLLTESLEFRRFWAGQSVSLLGDQVSSLALPLVAVLVLHAGAPQMGYLVAAGYAPNLIFSLHAGALVDRRGRRRATMLAADVGRAALLLTVPVAYWLGALSLAQLYAVAFLTGTLSVLFFVSYSTLFVSLVPRERYVEGTSLLNGSRAVTFMAGPSLAGLLVQLLSGPVALVADAATFVFSAFSLARIHPAEPPTETVESGHVVAGLRWLWRSPIMRASLLATATINFFNFVFFALFVLFATQELHVHPGLLGLVLGAGAIGGVVGSILSGRISRRIGVGPSFVLGCVLFPAPFALVPLAGGPQPLVLALLFLSELGAGFGVMLLDIAAGVIQAALVPDRLRARVSGAYMVVNYGVRPIGSLTAGALGASIGLRPTLWIAAVGGVLGVLGLIRSPIPCLRELPATAD